MKKMSEIIKSPLQDSLKAECKSVTLYQGETLNNTQAIELGDFIKVCFPRLKDEFITTLLLSAIEKGFTYQRMKDAVAQVRDNCKFPEPTMAQFLSHDVKVDLYTRAQMLEMCNPTNPMRNYCIVEVNGLKRYCKPEDAERAGLRIIRPAL